MQPARLHNPGCLPSRGWASITRSGHHMKCKNQCFRVPCRRACAGAGRGRRAAGAHGGGRRRTPRDRRGALPHAVPHGAPGAGLSGDLSIPPRCLCGPCCLALLSTRLLYTCVSNLWRQPSAHRNCGEYELFRNLGAGPERQHCSAERRMHPPDRPQAAGCWRCKCATPPALPLPRQVPCS